MIELRPFENLGKSDHGWLNANFHFSFADYRDPQRVHWGALRVWNNDRIAPDSGFPPHPHRGCADLRGGFPRESAEPVAVDRLPTAIVDVTAEECFQMSSVQG